MNKIIKSKFFIVVTIIYLLALLILFFLEKSGILINLMTNIRFILSIIYLTYTIGVFIVLNFIKK